MHRPGVKLAPANLSVLSIKVAPIMMVLAKSRMQSRGSRNKPRPGGKNQSKVIAKSRFQTRPLGGRELKRHFTRD